MESKIQRGFSLLELIASLAIVSLVSASLFQSMAAWMRLSARASSAADASLASITEQQMFGRVINGLIYAWPEEEKLIFEGAPDGFSGLSSTPLEGVHPKLVPVSILAATPQGSDRGQILYQSAGVKWTLEEFDGAATFSYLGADAQWRSVWPPDETPEPGPFDDALYFNTPQLPIAIRVDFVSGEDRQSWIAEIAGDPRIPQRIQDLR